MIQEGLLSATDVTKKFVCFDLTQKTLRDWDGCLKPIRKDNRYRYYNQNHIDKIRAMLILTRILNCPIKRVELAWESELDSIDFYHIVESSIQEVSFQLVLFQTSLLAKKNIVKNKA